MTTRRNLFREACDFLDPGTAQPYDGYRGRFGVTADGITSDGNGIREGVALALAYLCQCTPRPLRTPRR